MLTQSDLESGLQQLGLSGARVELHASFRSLGGAEGGADTVVSALTRVLDTVLVPAFCWDAMAPAPELIERNAAPEASRSERPAPRAFDPRTSPLDESMGVIARTIASQDGARRSSHPLCSWAAVGRNAMELVRDHAWDAPHLPIQRLLDLNGSVLLAGVTLTSCTAIHWAEELAGRRTFIRWVVDEHGEVCPARTGGCSGGFDRLLPSLDHLFRRERVGQATWLTASLAGLVETAASVIRGNPHITVCAARCERCLAAVAGGPVA